MPELNTVSTVPSTLWRPSTGAIYQQYNHIVERVTKRKIGGGGHYGFPDFPSRSDVGGPVTLQTTTYKRTPTKSAVWNRTNNPAQHRYTGVFLAGLSEYGLGTIQDGTAWGAEAYNKLKPTKPTFEALNFLAELRELPRMLQQRFYFNNLHELGDYTLALQFGWLSLLRDTRNLVNLQRNTEKRLRWLLEHNGKPVRRKKTIYEAMSTPVVTKGVGYYLTPSLETYYFNGPQTGDGIEWFSDKIWASARFRYWLPGGPRDIRWTQKMMRRLHGLRPTPSVVYNAMPWTWLIDYFANVGDVIENLDGGVADRLAADYFYVMREQHWHKENFVSGGLYDEDYRVIPVTAKSSCDAINKTRIKGDPFGINTNQDSLSSMQKAIIGALGLSRLR